MGERKFTFVELHFDGEAQFGPKRISDVVGRGLPGSAEDADAEDADAEDEALDVGDDSGGRGKSAVVALVALVVLAGLALAVRKFRGGEEERPIEERDEPDVVVD